LLEGKNWQTRGIFRHITEFDEGMFFEFWESTEKPLGIRVIKFTPVTGEDRWGIYQIKIS